MSISSTAPSAAGGVCGTGSCTGCVGGKSHIRLTCCGSTSVGCTLVGSSENELLRILLSSIQLTTSYNMWGSPLYSCSDYIMIYPCNAIKLRSKTYYACANAFASAG